MSHPRPRVQPSGETMRGRVISATERGLSMRVRPYRPLFNHLTVDGEIADCGKEARMSRNATHPIRGRIVDFST